MAYPRIEYILQNVASELADVTVANGFNQTLNVSRRSRYRITQGGFDNHDVVISSGTPIMIETPSQMHLEWHHPIHIWYFAVTSDATEKLIDQQLFTAWADIVRKLREDPYRGTDGSGGTGNRYAIDTLIDSPELNADESGGWEAINCRVRVHYRHIADNPFNP